MQLGTRWAMGSEPPARLPVEVTAAIREVESGDAAASPSRRWTLTWLEGLPIVELDPPADSDEFTTINFDPADRSARVTVSGADEEWEED